MLTRNILIREAAPSDAEIISEFNALIARETEDMHLPPEVVNPGVRTLLADASKGRYWVAEMNGRVVGQIMVTYEWSDWRNGMIWWIQSVYVHGEYRRSGVFSSLYRHVELLAREDPQVCGIRLYVECENVRAQRTYESLGMTTTDYRIMQSMFTGDE